MNQETIERHINSLGKTDFDAVIFLVMKKVFNMIPIDIDGKGDGGLDFRFFENDYKKRIGCQKSVVKEQWKSKAFRDAQKAKEYYPITQFYFFTSHAHTPIEIHNVEERIINELGIIAHCLSATEIAGYIVSHKLLPDFAHAINLDIDFKKPHQFDRREVLLHTYFALGTDCKNLQNEIFENTLVMFLFEQEKMNRTDLIFKSSNFLSLSDSESIWLDRRIDALLTAKKIQKQAEELFLSKELSDEIKIANSLYDRDVDLLSQLCRDIIESKSGKWSDDLASKMAILLAKCFVEKQIQNANDSSLSFSMTGFSSPLENPQDQLRELIMQTGISAAKIDEVLLSLIEVAKGNPLIQKLVSSVVYICLRQVSPNKSVAVLNTDTWENVKVYLDSSVAIPYITSALFGPSQERFSKGSNATIKVFSNLSTKLIIPYEYLNECASHLLAAKDYCFTFSDFDDDLAYSRNGYVSHYFQRKKMALKVPDSLREYIEILSPNVFKPITDRHTQIALIMQDLQEKFKEYNITWENYSEDKIKEYRKNIEIAYSYILADAKKNKGHIQIQHDINILAYLKQQSCDTAERLIMLTWDKTVIKLAREDSDFAWIVNPVEASDLVQARTSFSTDSLMSLGLSIAKVMTKKQETAGHIIDKIVEFSNGDLEDYEYRKKILKIRKEAFALLDQQEPDFNVAIFEQETNRLFEKNGINLSTKEPDFAEITDCNS